MTGPCASYEDRSWPGGPGKFVGYDAVGPGWKHLLEILDRIMVRAIENARINAAVTLPEHREEGNTAEASVEILQIKEKFGGLRVYFQTKGMSIRFREYLNGAASFAECMSLRTCEVCGAEEGVETRPNSQRKYSRTLTLCTKHHQERDERPPGEWFQMGNGDKVG